MRRIVLLLAASMALAVLLAGGVAGAAATVTFAPAKNYPAGDDPVAVATADFNKDGLTDIATANRAIDRVSVLIRRSDGAFRAPVKYATGDYPTDIIGREDFDGDKDIDLAISNNFSNNISVLLNKGNGTFAAQRKYATVGLHPMSIESGRFDRDGDWDLVTADIGDFSALRPGANGGIASVFLNKGNGTFTAARRFGVTEPYELWSVDRADLDGDGDEDLAFGRQSARAEEPGISVLLGGGDGTFGVARKYNLPDAYRQTDGANDIIAAYLNGDGYRDLVTTGYSNYSSDGNEQDGSVLYVYLGNGDGTFQVQDRLPSVGSEMTEADFDRDGDVDIATIGGGDSAVVSKVSILANAGDATFGNESTVYPTFSAGKGSEGIIRTRMNSDNKPDLVVANSASDNVSVLINTTQ